MADVDERLDKYDERITEIDRRTTKHEARIELAERRLDDGKAEMAAIRERMDANHGETTRQLSEVGIIMGEVSGSLKTLRWGIPTAITLIGVVCAAVGVIGKSMGFW